jgi:flotillin
MIIAIAAIVVLALAIGLFKACWKTPAPDEALIIAGLGRPEGDAPVYRVVIGRGTFVNPLFARTSRLSLQVIQADLSVDCVTVQGIEIQVQGVVMFKIGDTDTDITNASKRFYDQQDNMQNLVLRTFDGHLRTIVGGMTMEDLLTNRDQLTTQTREASGIEMAKLGLAIDSLQISKITDATGYIDSLSAPHVAQVQSAARIAQARRGQEASIAEAEAAAETAEAKRASEIRQAAAQADVDKAKAESAQAGPLADATAKQKVTEAETRAAQLAADLEEQRLQTSVRRPADAEAYRTTTLAEANRQSKVAEAQAAAETRRLAGTAEAEAIQATGEAEAGVVRAKGMAEAETIKARAEALEVGQQAVIAQMLADKFPEIVAAAAAPIGNIDKLTVLNGADGVTGILASVLEQAAALFPSLQDKLGISANPNTGSQGTSTSKELVEASSTDGHVVE